MDASLNPNPTDCLDLRAELQQAGYNALLNSHCQLVDQVANLTVVVIQLWEQNAELRNRLALPRIPFPPAALAAVAARPAAPTMCDRRRLAGEES